MMPLYRLIRNPGEDRWNASARMERQLRWRALRAGMLPVGQNDGLGGCSSNYPDSVSSEVRVKVVDRSIPKGTFGSIDDIDTVDGGWQPPMPRREILMDRRVVTSNDVRRTDEQPFHVVLLEWRS